MTKRPEARTPELAELRAQRAALDRAMATIEFTLDGTITAVNDVFCQFTGYRRDELVGQHHRMFCDPTWGASPGYGKFWEDLRGGVIQSGEFERFVRGGRPVWIQAFYARVNDASGRPYKVIKYATDVTAAKQAATEAAGTIDAVRRSMAVIYFRPDGGILEANDLFLATMGCRAEDIAGKHHRMFMAPEDAASPAYANFWDKLRRGEGISGEFRRFTPDRREVWLQASYTPIVDGKGQVVKVVKVGSDITARKMAETVIQPEIERVLKAAVDGDFTARIDVSPFPSGFLRNVGQGLNELMDTLGDSFRTVKSAIDQISQAGHQLRTTSQMMSTGSVELRTAAESSSKSLTRVSDGVRANAENAAMANQIVTEASRTARAGQERMSELSSAITDVQGAAQQIARIIRVIDEIAFQTNLLALNAAVEAARAGRHGKGFAVVAQEVRTLAERSARAAKETAQLIEDTGAKVEQGVRLTTATRSSLEEIVGSVVKIVDLVGEIDAASNEQARALHEVSGSVGQVTESAQSGSQQSIEVAAAAEELGRQMEVLKQRMDRFKVPSAPSTAALGGQLSPALLEQIMALVRAANGAAPSIERAVAAAVGGGALPRGAVPSGVVSSGADPRAVLPLDRDERGYGGF